MINSHALSLCQRKQPHFLWVWLFVCCPLIYKVVVMPSAVSWIMKTYLARCDFNRTTARQRRTCGSQCCICANEFAPTCFEAICVYFQGSSNGL